jgi:hypothetical protein
MFCLIFELPDGSEKYNYPSDGDSLQVLAKKRTGINTRSLDDSIVHYEIKLHQLVDSASVLYERRKQKLNNNEDVSKIDKQLSGIKNGNIIYRARLDSFINVSQKLFSAQPEIILNTKKAKPKY